VFLFCNPNSSIPSELVENRTVLVCDVDLGTENLCNVIEKASSVRLIDHHSGTEKSIEVCTSKYPEKFSYVFDKEINESAASLTWKEFHPDSPIPPLVTAVQISDTWNFEQSPMKVEDIMEALYVKGRCIIPAVLGRIWRCL